MSIGQDLGGRKALVTGGSRGIGAAIARTLAARGADVAITYAASEAKAAAVVSDIQAMGRKALAIKADSADQAEVEAAVAQAHEALGGLDILVNNAGIARAGALEEMSVEDIDALIGVNIRGVVLTTRAAIPRLANGGRIITIGSSLGAQVQMPGISVYAMTKSALVSLTRGLARDLGARDITVNVVQPGCTDTDMNPADGPLSEGLLSMMPLKRYGKGEDIGAMVAFLSGPGGRQITGAAFTVDGGLNA